MQQTNSNEDILFASPNVVVTDRRILLGARSYAASAISSVEVGRGASIATSKSAWGSPGAIFGMIIATFGVVFAALAIGLARDLPVVTLLLVTMSVLIVVLGLLIVTAARRAYSAAQTTSEPYAVHIHTLHGQKERIAGLSEGKAQELANAISLASTMK